MDALNDAASGSDQEKALAYKNADRTKKFRILDKIFDLTGWHRDYARLLRGGFRTEIGQATAEQDIAVWSGFVGPMLGGATRSGEQAVSPDAAGVDAYAGRYQELDVTDAQARLLMRRRNTNRGFLLCSGWDKCKVSGIMVILLVLHSFIRHFMVHYQKPLHAGERHECH